MTAVGSKRKNSAEKSCDIRVSQRTLGFRLRSAWQLHSMEVAWSQGKSMLRPRFALPVSEALSGTGGAQPAERYSKDWRDMRERESAIWGDTDRPSSIKVEVDFPDNWSTRKVSLRKYERDLNRRYALFPPYNKKGVALDDARKDGFLEGGNFTLTLSVAEREHKDDAEAALWAWVNLGGLGARTRRGAALCSAILMPGGMISSLTATDGCASGRLSGRHRSMGRSRKGPRAWEDAWTDVLQLYREFRQDRQGRGRPRGPSPTKSERSANTRVR